MLTLMSMPVNVADGPLVEDGVRTGYWYQGYAIDGSLRPAGEFQWRVRNGSLFLFAGRTLWQCREWCEGHRLG